MTSRNAILYVIRELGRRAGAAPDWIAGWRVRFQDTSLTLYPEPDSTVRLKFPFDPSKPNRFPQLRDAPLSRWSWMYPPESRLLDAVPDFGVLFDKQGGEQGPLFAPTSPDVIECCADILTSALWTLARFEELWHSERDSHGRFPASASAAFRCNCLERPIVDEYALAFRQALSHLLPRWKSQPFEPRLKLSHDIDLVGLPRQLRSTIGHIYPRRIPGAFFRDAFSAFGTTVPAYLESVRETGHISLQGGFDSAFYWKACDRTPWDSGYDLRHPQVAAVIGDLLQQGFEMGIHPAYDTFGAADQLQGEVDRVRGVLGSGPIGGRQHFLRWAPSTWRDWEKAGLAYDSSVGFADAIGFRAGTAVPYHPWLIEEDRESTLLEIPLVVMDCTLTEYMRLQARDVPARIAALVRRCQTVGGVFTLLWHNSSVMEQPYKSLYSPILNLFTSRARYDWKADLKICALPRAIEDSN